MPQGKRDKAIGPLTIRQANIARQYIKTGVAKPQPVDSTSPAGSGVASIKLVPQPSPYQLQCTERILALTRFCYEEYNVDPLHVRLIASALLPSNQLPLWMIYETVRTPFWNHLNYAIKGLGMKPITNIAGMRMLRNTRAHQWYMSMAVDRHENPHVFIDTMRLNSMEWRRRIPSGHGYWALTAECGRATIPVPMLRLPRLGAEEEFLRLLRMVLDPHARKVLPEPIAPSPPLVEIIHALPRLNDELEDGEALFSNITMLPSSHAALYGRTKDQLVDLDWYSMMQVIRGSIRQYLKDILYWFYLEDSKMRTWVESRTLANALGRQMNLMNMQLGKLVAQGVIVKWKANNGRGPNRKTRYALTDLGMLGACIVGAGPGAKWWA